MGHYFLDTQYKEKWPQFRVDSVTVDGILLRDDATGPKSRNSSRVRKCARRAQRERERMFEGNQFDAGARGATHAASSQKV